MTGFLHRHEWLAKLALCAGSLVVALAAVEVFLRVSGKDHSLVWRPDPVLGWWHIPHSSQHWIQEGDGWVFINGVGIRDVERTVQKPAGVFRIAVFGDSMTEGVQVNLDQTFERLLEHQLTEHTGRRVEVLNFGVNGYSPLQEYLLYKEHGAAFAPDLVLHAVFLDNDVADLDPKLASGQRGAPFVTSDASDSFHIDYSAALESSRSYDREPIASIRRVSAVYRLISDARYRRIGEIAFVDGRTANKGVPKRYLLYADPPERAWERAWGDLEQITTRFADDVHRAGGKYALISVPAGQVVNPEAWQQLMTTYPEMAERRWDLRGPEARIHEIARRSDVSLIAPLDIFAAAADRKQLFFGTVGHMTPAGHRLMATALERAIVEGGFLDGSRHHENGVVPTSVH